MQLYLPPFKFQSLQMYYCKLSCSGACLLMAIGAIVYIPILVYLHIQNHGARTHRNWLSKIIKTLNMTPCHGSAQPAKLSYQSGAIKQEKQ